MKSPTANQNGSNSLPKGTPKSLLKAYSWVERRRAKDIQIKISKDSNRYDDVYINCIFVSVAFPNGKSFIASENPVFVFKESRKFMDAGGRVYKDWNDYLHSNHFEQGVMIYPKDGNYTPKKSDGTREAKITLIANETQSCKPSARVKNVLDTVVFTTGLVLAGTAVVTAVPLGIFSATTLATFSTGSYWLGLASTIYSVTFNGYDKFTHDETVVTEILLVGTTLLSNFTASLNQYWGKRMAELVKKTDVWDDVAQSLTRTQKFVFASLNLIKVAMSASSVWSAFWHIFTKKNRTWLDYYQLCISIFFFTNTVTKPIFLQQVFESEKARFTENYLRNINEIREKVHREEAKQELEKTIENAKTNEQKTYLIRNLQKIHDLDGHFYRIHETGSIVEYNEKGMLINNQITIAPEAYNQMGKEQLEQKLNDIKKYPTEAERNKYVATLVKDYESEDFTELAEKYVNENMTAEERTQFDKKMKEMAVRRKDQFFRDTATFKETNNYRETMGNKETEMAGGKNVEAWKEEQRKLKADKDAGNITEEQYKQEERKIKDVREIRKTIDKYVQNPWIEQEGETTFMRELDAIKNVANDDERNKRIDRLIKNYDSPELKDFAKDYATGNMTADRQAVFNQELEKTLHRTVFNDYVRNHANGRTENEWKQTYENLKEQYDKLPENAKTQERVKQRFEEYMSNAQKNMDSAKEARTRIESVRDESWVKETRDLYGTKENYEKNERFIWHVTNDATKSAIEEIWEVTDYRTAMVDGKPIFKDMDLNAINDMNCIISNARVETIEQIKLARDLAKDSNCKMKAGNSREFGHLINAVRQASEGVNSMDYDKILKEINTTYTKVEAIISQDKGIQFTSINSAVTHTSKHKTESGLNTTTKDYLTTNRDNLIKPQNSNGSVYTQDGQRIITNYGETQNGRYNFGVTRSDANGNNPRVVTMHVRSDVGNKNSNASNPTTNNLNNQNPGNGSSASSSASQNAPTSSTSRTDFQDFITNRMCWLPSWFS